MMYKEGDILEYKGKDYKNRPLRYRIKLFACTNALYWATVTEILEQHLEPQMINNSIMIMEAEELEKNFIKIPNIKQDEEEII